MAGNGAGSSSKVRKRRLTEYFVPETCPITVKIAATVAAGRVHFLRLTAAGNELHASAHTLRPMSVPRKEDDALRAILRHLKNAVERNEGISLARLQGKLSQLPPKARGNFSASASTIRLVTRRFPGTIFVDVDNNVYSCTHSDGPCTTEPCKQASDGEEDDIIELCNVNGTVQYLSASNVYGFIMVNYPVKANVFFDRKAVEGGKHKDLKKAKVKLGSAVLLSAVRSPLGHKARFQATNVECYDGTTAAMPADSPPSPEPPPPSQPGEDEMILNRTGYIHSIKPNYGFISFGPKQESCTFFHRNKVKKTVLKPNQKLSDIFAAGDAVCFNARPSSRCTKFVKWQATMVTKIVEHDEPRVTSQPDDEDDDDDFGDEVFMSGDESEIAELLEGDEREDVIDGDADECAVGHPDWEASSRRPEQSNTELCTGYSAGRKLLGTEGTLFPDSDTTALVFCLGIDTALLVEIGVVYHQGRQIKSFDELLSNSSNDGAAEVFVDAVEVASDVWAATLVWTGERPLRRYREDTSERRVPNLITDAARLGGPDSEAVGRHTVGTFSSVPEVDCSVKSYRAVRGTVLRVEQCKAVCAVQESDKPRRIEFTCFYRNGTAYYSNLDRVIQEGAAVNVNYMVGVANDGNEKVYCSLVWQGLTPPGVDQLSPQEFRQLLDIVEAQPEAPSTAAADNAPHEVLQSRENAVQGGHRNTGSTDAPLVQQATSFDLPSRVAHSSLPPLNIPTGSKAAGKQWTPPWGQPRGHSLSTVVDEESTSHAEASTPLTVPTAPSVPVYDRVEASTAAKSIATTGVQNGEASWNVEFTDDYDGMDEEITMEELNELFEEDEEVMLDYQRDWKGREEEIAPCDNPAVCGRKLEAWAPRLDAGDPGGKLDVSESTGQAAAQLDSHSTQVQQQADVPESVSAGPDREMAAREAQAPEEGSEDCRPEADTPSCQQPCESAQELEQAPPAAVAAPENAVDQHFVLTVEMFDQLATVLAEIAGRVFEEWARGMLIEMMQRSTTEHRDAETQVDESGPCTCHPPSSHRT